EALHAVVPALGPPARAAALKLKRAAHNSRDCDLDGESLSQIASRLPAAACTVLDRWMALQRSAANHLDEAIRAHDEELIAHVRPRLAALAGSESFRRPLVLASRSVFDELIRQTEVNTNAAKITRLERTLVSYLARA